MPALLWGVAFANIVAGVPIDADKEFTGNLFTLLNPYGLLGGLVTLTLFLTHGAMFVALKTDGDIRHRARALSVKLGLVAAVRRGRVPGLDPGQVPTGRSCRWCSSRVAAVALLGSICDGHRRAARAGRSSAPSSRSPLAVAGPVLALFPDVMPSTTDAAYSLMPHTTNASAHAQYTLKVMTWVAVIFTPIVLVYQALDLLGVPQADRHPPHPRPDRHRRGGLTRHTASS